MSDSGLTFVDDPPARAPTGLTFIDDPAPPRAGSTPAAPTSAAPALTFVDDPPAPAAAPLVRDLDFADPALVIPEEVPAWSTPTPTTVPAPSLAAPAPSLAETVIPPWADPMSGMMPVPGPAAAAVTAPVPTIPPPAPAPAPAPAPPPTSLVTDLDFADPALAAQGFIPAEEPGQPFVDTGQGFGTGLRAGGALSLRDAVQAASGNAFTVDPTRPAGPKDPGFFYGIGHGIGYAGGPVLAGGAAGTAGGAAVGGPFGALVGGALGTALASAAIDLVPTYAAFRQAHPEGTHEDAVTYTIKHAAAMGGIMGITAPLFAITPVRNILGKILVQALVTQPVAGAAVRTGVPAVLGEPLPSWDELKQGAGQDAVTGAIFGAGASAARFRPRQDEILPPLPREPAGPGQQLPGPPPREPIIIDMEPPGGPRPAGPGEPPPPREPPAPAPPAEPAAAPAPAVEPAPAGAVSPVVEPATAPAPPSAGPPVPAGTPAPVSVPTETTAGPGAAAPVAAAPPTQPAAVPTSPSPEPVVAGPPDGQPVPAVAPAAPTPAEPVPAVAPAASTPAAGAATVSETGVPAPTPAEAAPVTQHSREDFISVVGGTFSLSPEDKATMAASIEQAVAQKGAVTFEDLPREITNKLEMDQLVNIKKHLGNPGLILDVLRGDTSRVAPSQAQAAAPTVEPVAAAPTPAATQAAVPAAAAGPAPAARAPSDYLKLDPNISGEEYARRLAELRDNKPRPINRLWRNPETAPPEEVAAARAALSAWNREYRQVSKIQKLALERDNEAYRAGQAPANLFDVADGPPRETMPGLENLSTNRAILDEQLAAAEQRHAELSPVERAGIRLNEEQQETGRIEGEPPRAGELTTEPDDKVPGQHVAKNAEGQVVGKGRTPEAARVDAQARQNEPYAETEGEVVPGQEAEAGTTTADTDPTLQKLRATRDALTNKVQTRADAQKLARINDQIARREKALQKAEEDRRGASRVRPFTGPPQVGRERDLLDYKFNDGVSVFESVFEEAGYNPDLAVSFPIERQSRILGDHMKNKFGFTDVTVVPAKTGTGRVDHFRAVQAMLDMTRALMDGMASMGLPHSAASLNGTLRLVIDPEGQVNYYGAYSHDGAIHITGGANSYGHEWTHALDHLLAERFTGNPRDMNDLLSRYARNSGLDTRDNVQAAFAKLINTLFYEDAALAARHLALTVDAQKVDRQGNPTKGALEAQDKLMQLEGGGSKLRIHSSEFRLESAKFHPPKAGYYASVYEMLARSHEAYLANLMQLAGRDPRGFVMPDEAYLNMVDRQLRMAYPKGDDRLAIFAAWDEVHHALRREQILTGGQPAGAFSDFGISDSYRWRTTAPNAHKTPLGQALLRELRAIKNWNRTLAERGGVFDKTRPKAPRTVGQRFMDHSQAVFYSNRGFLKAIIARMPPEAKAILQPIKDSVATDPGSGRRTNENFHETVEKRRKTWNFQYGNIKAKQGYTEYEPMPLEERLMLRHILVTGEDTYPVDPSMSSAGRVKIPDRVLKVHRDVRKLLNQLWNVSDQAGLKIGHAVNGFYPRHYDRYRAAADPAGFKAKATELHDLMFDQELGAPGSNPQALLEKWTQLPRISKISAAAKAGSNVDLIERMNELRKNLEKQKDPNTPPGDLPTLEAEARQMAADAHPLIRDFISELNAAEWHKNLVGGALHDFDTSATPGSYLQARKLPPEADIIMREFMEQDPDVALPAYFSAVARRATYAEQFGPDSEVLNEAKDKLAGMPGVDGFEIDKFFTVIDDMTGKVQRGGVKGFLQIPHNLAQGVAAMVLMPRALWSSLHEGMTASAVTGNHLAGVMTIGKSFGQLWGTASAKDRTALAEFLGVITSPQYDSTMLSRMGAAYDDSPKMGWLLQQFYRTTGLTAITNGSRAASLGTSHWFLDQLSQHLLDTGTDTKAKHARDEATRWFNELGLPEEIHQRFAQWIVDMGGKTPTPEMLSFKPGEQPGSPGSNALQGENAGMKEGIVDGMGDAYSLAIRRLVDRIIQDPKPADRAVLANVPIFGMAFQLMSFAYSFHENVLLPAAKKILYQYTRGRQEARDAGSGPTMANIKATFGTVGTAVNTLAIAASMVGAALMSLLVRQVLFAWDQLEQHAKDGDLLDYLLRTAISRSGLLGKWDAPIQTANHMKYNSDITGFTTGAARNWAGKTLNDVMAPLLGDNSLNTNTAEFNQAKGMFSLIGTPVAAYYLTLLGSMGPLARIASGVALQAGTSPQAANLAGYLWAGEKGVVMKPGQRGGVPRPSPPSTPPGRRGAVAPDKGSGFLGLVGDFAIPAVGYTLGQIAGMSPAARIAGGVATGAGAAYTLYQANQSVAPFRGRPAAPRRPAQ